MKKHDTHIYLSDEARACLEKLSADTDLSLNKIIERLLLGKSVGHLQFKPKR